MQTMRPGVLCTLTGKVRKDHAALRGGMSSSLQLPIWAYWLAHGMIQAGRPGSIIHVRSTARSCRVIPSLARASRARSVQYLHPEWILACTTTSLDHA